MSGALKSARARNPLRQASWVEPNWFDFLNRVMKKEPVVVRGPMGFGLKTVARSLKDHGLIETHWPNGVTDGLGAMVAAWWCADAARMQGVCLSDVGLMSEVSDYNEVDCRVMMEAVGCLRARGAAMFEGSAEVSRALHSYAVMGDEGKLGGTVLRSRRKPKR